MASFSAVAYGWLPLVYIIRLAVGQTVNDAITLRWHGKYYEQYPLLRGWLPHPPFPTNVCRFSVAVCVDIKVNECIRSPGEFRYPYIHRAEGGAIEGKPCDHCEHGGGYLYLSESRLEGDTETSLMLWSNCSAGCGSCGAKTGLLDRPLKVNRCGQTLEGSVYSVMYPAVQTNCVVSLSAYYAQVAGELGMARGVKAFDPARLWTISCVVLFACAASIALMWLYSNWMRHRRRPQEQAAVATGGEMVPNAIGKSRIEHLFPSTCMVGGDEPTCIVCLGPIQIDQVMRELQCGHCFHVECIDSWWLHRPRVVLECPLCKQSQRLDEPEGAPSDDPEAAAESAEHPALREHSETVAV